MSRTVKATISYGDRAITFEGPENFVNEQVEKYTIARQATQATNEAVQGHEDTADSAPVGRRLPPVERSGVRERDLVQLKKPKNHPETVAVLAFALAENGIKEFTEEDIHRAYLRAGVRPPKVISQAIRDAKNNHDFIEMASQRGHFRLSNHGDRTVRFDLPQSG